MQIHPIVRSWQHTRQAGLALVCAFSWQLSNAQTHMPSTASAESNPAASVPAVVYRSVFKETSLGVEKDSADWRKANDAVGKFTRGHVDILKWEEQEAAKAMPDAMKPIAAPAHKH